MKHCTVRERDRFLQGFVQVECTECTECMHAGPHKIHNLLEIQQPTTFIFEDLPLNTHSIPENSTHSQPNTIESSIDSTTAPTKRLRAAPERAIPLPVVRKKLSQHPAPYLSPLKPTSYPTNIPTNFFAQTKKLLVPSDQSHRCESIAAIHSRNRSIPPLALANFIPHTQIHNSQHIPNKKQTKNSSPL